MYVRMKLHEAKQKSQKLVLQITDTENANKRHQLEVDLAYLWGKASAYIEIEELLTNTGIHQENIQKTLEKIANEVIVEWRIRKLKQLTDFQKNQDTSNSFEAGVEAMKMKLIKALSPIDVSILELEKEEKRDSI